MQLDYAENTERRDEDKMDNRLGNLSYVNYTTQKKSSNKSS